MLAVVLVLAATMTDGPCGAVDKSVAIDAIRADDSLLREAAGLAEDAGDHLLASRLLIRLRDRTRDEGIRYEAADALQSLNTKAARVSCEAPSRDVVIHIDADSFLTPAERTRMETFALNELRSRNLDASVDKGTELSSCNTDEKCLRFGLLSRTKGAFVRLSPVRVGPVVSLGVRITGFKGHSELELELDGDSARWSPVLSREVLDNAVALVPPPSPRDTRKPREEPASNVDAVIAGVVVSSVGALTAGAGVVALVQPQLLGRASDQNVLIGGGLIAGGGLIIVSGLVAVALLVDSRD